MPQNHARGRRRCSSELRQTGTGGCTRHVCIMHACVHLHACRPEEQAQLRQWAGLDWLPRARDTHGRAARTGNKSSCSRSTAVGSPSMADAAKQWRGLSSSLLLNLSIFFLWLTWNPVNTSNALDRAGRERTESPWGCADRFSNPVKSDSSGLA